MNFSPPLISAMTTVLVVLFTNLGTALVARGYISTGDVTALAAAAATVALYAISGLLGWWKTQEVTPAGLVKNLSQTSADEVARAVYKADPEKVVSIVNQADNGLKVVPADSTSVPAVDRPVK